MYLGYACIQCIPGTCLRCGISDGKEQQPFYEEKSQDLNLKKKYVKDIHASLELLIWITCPDNPALEWPSCPYGCLSKSLNSYEADQLSLLLFFLSLYLELPCSFPPWKSQAVKYQIHVLELDIVSSVRQICSL